MSQRLKLLSPLKRTGSTSGAVQVTVSTGNRTAIAPTTYTALSTEAATFADGVDTSSVTVYLNDVDNELNQMFDVYIDAGSATNNASIGTDDSALVSILGSGGSSTAVVDMDLDSGAGYNNTAVWEMEDFVTNVPGTGAYSGEEYEQLTETGAVGGDVMVQIAGDRVTTANEDASHLTYDVEFGDGGAGEITYPTTFYFSIRARCDKNWHDNTWIWVDDAVVDAVLINLDHVEEDHTWDWCDYVAYTIQTEGTHTITVGKFESYQYMDRMLVTHDNTYDPTVVGIAADPFGDKGGPIGGTSASSGTTVGAATADPNNPTTPLNAPVAGSISADTLIPADNATQVLRSAIPSAVFDGVGIDVETFTLTYNAEADSVSGTFGGTGGNTAVFDPISLANSVEYEATTTGTIVDNDDQIRKAFSEQWSFTVIPVQGTGDIVASVDFSSVSPGFEATKSWLGSTFQADQSYFGITYYEKGYDPSYDHSAIVIVDDPAGSTGRGNVMRVHQGAGGYGYTDGDDPPSGASFGFATALSNIRGTWTTLYFSYDYYRSAVNEFTGLPPRLPRIHKVPGLAGGKWGDAAGGSQPDGTDGFSCRGIAASSYGFPGRVPAGNFQSIMGYSYAAFDPWSAKGLWPDDGSIGDPAYRDTYYFPLGEWITIEQQITLNTAGSPAATDGIFKQWVRRPSDQVGQLVTDRSDVPWRVDADLKINGAWIIFGYGGNDSSYSVPESQYHYYDNFILSTSRITD